MDADVDDLVQTLVGVGVLGGAAVVVYGAGELFGGLLRSEPVTVPETFFAGILLISSAGMGIVFVVGCVLLAYAVGDVFYKGGAA
jgi:hypothetical protein